MAPPRKYSSELRERPVRLIFELREQGERAGVIARVADQLGVHREALRTWVRQAEDDGGKRPGTSASDIQRIADLERENRELRRPNEILEPIRAVLEVSPSTCWAAKKRESAPSARAVRDEWLKEEILRVWREPGRGLSGARKVWSQLRRDGVEVHGQAADARTGYQRSDRTP